MWLLGGPLGFCVLICILCSRSVRTLRSRCATPCRLGALACANQDFLEIAHNLLGISWNFLEIRIGALVRSYAPIRISRERYEISRELCEDTEAKWPAQ